MEPPISVIVSMYNIEKYIEECIISLVKQTLEGIEIILVDDGSKDHTLQIAQRYEKEYPNIRVITKKNGGLSSARNAGLDIARGQYVAFVDGDDYVLSNMYELMYASAVKYNSDMVMIGHMRLLEDGTRTIDREMTHQKIFTQTQVIRKKDNIIEDVLGQMIGMPPEAELDVELNMCVWRNIYRRKILDENSIRFLSERQYISEDIMFHLEVLPLLDCISTVCEATYVYRFNQNSLTKTYRPERFQKECFLYNAVYKRMEELGLEDGFQQRFDRTFIGRVRNCILSEIYTKQQMSLHQRKENIKQILNNEIVRKVIKEYPIQRMNLKLKVFTIMMKKRQINALVLLGYLYQRRFSRK
ncbi:MAG: glycosyltransferase [Lachnospiraceae bacterium]|nr:glycosyltransferase [Lachnospiraceae bacterium]